MADIIVDQNAASFDISNQLPGFSRVVIKTGQTDSEGNDVAYIAGDETGLTLEIENPWGTQEIADNILSGIGGFAYQPMLAESATLNPAFEVGDSVIVNGVYSGIYSASVNFSRTFSADIQAPSEKEIDHEYSFEDSRERRYMRKVNDAVARLNFYADEIEAKVDKNGGSETFGWSLTENQWSVFNQDGTIFYINENGAYVKGEIQSDSGKIGGFDIGANALYKDMTSLYDEEHNGVYIGTDGISLGKGKFRVDAAGNIYAQSGNFDGNIYAKNIQFGGEAGYLSGAGIAADNMLWTGNFAQGIIDSLGFADFSWDVFNNRQIADYITARSVNCTSTITANLYYVRGEDEEAGGFINRHTHKITTDQSTGKVTLGAPDWTGRNYSFNIADTAFYRSAVSAAKTEGAESAALRSLSVGAAGTPYDYNSKKYSDVVVNYTVSAVRGDGSLYTISNSLTKAVDVTAVWDAAGGGQSEVSVSNIYSTRFASNYQTVYVRATLSDGSISNEFAIDISTAWNNGYETGWGNVDVSWSDGDYDIWISPYYYDSWEEVCGGLLHAKLTNGREQTRRLDRWDA